MFRNRLTLPILAALLCLPGHAQPTDGTDRLLLPAAAPMRTDGLAERPNVLLIMADDLNVALGSYLESTPAPHYAGVKTPNLDRLAAEGVRFDRAYVQNPLCNPSRISILSGLRPLTTGVYDNGTAPRERIGDDLRLLPEHFHDQGYFTARVGKIGHNSYEHVISWDSSNFALSREPAVRFHLPGYLPGVDLSGQRDNTWTEGSEHGMSRADVLAPLGRTGGLPLSWRATTESPRMTPDGTTATRVIQLMADNRDKPFFIGAGFHKPHQPWVGPAQFFDQHPADAVQLPQTPPGDTDDLPAAAFEPYQDDLDHSDRQLKQAIAAYHSMVTMTDFYVGQLLAALEALDLAESTIVVFTSDHGFLLSEHGGLWRKRYQFEESTRVPLIVRLPDGRQAGAVAAGLVELVDLYPTLIEFSHLPQPAHALEGTSLRPLLDDPGRRWKSAAFSESVLEGFHGRTLRTARYRYTEWTPVEAPESAPERELYDHDGDPFEYNNLATEPAHRALVDELSQRLRAGWQAALPESA